MRKEKDTANIAVKIIQFIFALILIVMIGFSFIGCSTVRYVPIENIEKIIYKDSTIYVNDTITVEVEKQIVKEVLPQLDTSILQTDLASSIAYLDTNKRQIHHTLKQEGNIKFVFDTVYVTNTVEKIIEKEIPIEVEIEKKVVPEWTWWSLIFNIVVVLLVVFCMYVKNIKKL